MKARIVDYLYITPTRQRLTLDLEEDFRESYDKLKDADINVTVKKYSAKRSLDANAYFWVLIDKLSTETRIPVKDLYFDALKNCGGNVMVYCSTPAAIDKMAALWEQQGTTGWGWPYDRFDSKIDGCENIRLYYGSSAMDKATFSRLLDNLIQDCKTCGVETMTDEELNSLMEASYGKTR